MREGEAVAFWYQGRIVVGSLVLMHRETNRVSVRSSSVGSDHLIIPAEDLITEGEDDDAGF